MLTDKLSIDTQLQQQFGFDDFRGGQRLVIEQLLDGNSTIAIFPTGSGKSLCYQFTAVQLPYLTLVVSPLLALMNDQLAFLDKHNIPAAKIDSNLSFEEYQQVISEVRSGKTKILMVSVERFKNERFRQFIGSVKLSLLVVDEAHCISEWGHNFRPDYLKLPEYQKELTIPLSLLLTATATANVKQDMASKFAIEKEHIVQTGFYRENLNLNVQYAPQSEKNNQLVDYLSQRKGAGIVYVTLQHQADEVAALLKQQGFDASSYHAGLPDEQRQKIQRDFMDNKLDIVVATIAFGMGVDKANIRYVIHYELPKSLESYSQEIGRAGRDGKTSDCMVLANLDGLATLENFVYGDTPDQLAISKLLQQITEETEEGRWEMQLLQLSNACNIRQLPLKTLLVQLELLGVIKPLFSYFAEFKFRFIADKTDIIGQFEGERSTFVSEIFRASPMKRVWASLDFNSFNLAYPNSRKRLVSALDYMHEKGLIELQSKRNTEVFSVDASAITSEQLAIQLTQYFSDKEFKEVRRIESLVDFFQKDECLSANLSHYFDDPQANECGHCHWCLNGKFTLPSPQKVDAPEQQELSKVIASLKMTHKTKLGETITMEGCCRFLAGISSPFLTRIRAKSLDGYGVCSAMRYGDIRKLVTPIYSQD